MRRVGLLLGLSLAVFAVCSALINELEKRGPSSAEELAVSVRVGLINRDTALLNSLVWHEKDATGELNTAVLRWGIGADSKVKVLIHPEADYQGSLVFDDNPEHRLSIRQYNRYGWHLASGCDKKLVDPHFQCSSPKW
jgi:hypothetical protein